MTWSTPACGSSTRTARRAGSRRPDLAPRLDAIAATYANLRYGRANADPTARQRFHQSIKAFRPR